MHGQLHIRFTLNGIEILYSTGVLRMLCDMAFNYDHVSFEINVKPYVNVHINISCHLTFRRLMSTIADVPQR